MSKKARKETLRQRFDDLVNCYVKTYAHHSKALHWLHDKTVQHTENTGDTALMEWFVDSYNKVYMTIKAYFEDVERLKSTHIQALMLDSNTYIKNGKCIFLPPVWYTFGKKVKDTMTDLNPEYYFQRLASLHASILNNERRKLGLLPACDKYKVEEKPIDYLKLQPKVEDKHIGNVSAALGLYIMLEDGYKNVPALVINKFVEVLRKHYITPDFSATDFRLLAERNEFVKVSDNNDIVEVESIELYNYKVRFLVRYTSKENLDTLRKLWKETKDIVKAENEENCKEYITEKYGN